LTDVQEGVRIKKEQRKGLDEGDLKVGVRGGMAPGVWKDAA